MKNHLKIIPMTLSALFLLAACGSASSDAKKVDVKTVEVKTEKPIEVAKADTSKTEPAKKTEVAKEAPPVAQPKSEFVEGVHYVEIFPEMQTNVGDGKVEVVELMWFGCPHCYTLEPTILEYKKNLPPYVEFTQVPAMLNPSWAADANTYYLAEILDPKGEKDLIVNIFKTIHEQKRRMSNPEAVMRFFIQYGYTEEDINKAKQSMLFRTKIKRAQQISAASQAQSVPAIIINGRYRTSPYMAGDEEKLMKIVDMLTRRENKKK